MEMRIDETGNHGAARHLEEMGAGTDHRFQFGKFAVRENRPFENRDRVAFRMPEDYSLVNNQVGFIKRHLLLESSTHPDPSVAPSRQTTACSRHPRLI